MYRIVLGCLLVSRGQTLSRRALSIRDDKRPHEKGLVQVQYLTLSPSQGVKNYIIQLSNYSVNNFAEELQDLDILNWGYDKTIRVVLGVGSSFKTHPFNLVPFSL